MNTVCITYMVAATWKSFLSRLSYVYFFTLKFLLKVLLLAYLHCNGQGGTKSRSVNCHVSSLDNLQTGMLYGVGSLLFCPDCGTLLNLPTESEDTIPCEQCGFTENATCKSSAQRLDQLVHFTFTSLWKYCYYDPLTPRCIPVRSKTEEKNPNQGTWGRGDAHSRKHNMQQTYHSELIVYRWPSNAQTVATMKRTQWRSKYVIPFFSVFDERMIGVQRIDEKRRRRINNYLHCKSFHGRPCLLTVQSCCLVVCSMRIRLAPE